MCFTPSISLSIFLIEWVLGFIVLSKRPKNALRKMYTLAAVLLFFLGAHQFTQFMFCVSGDFELWGTLGFLAYNFLPAIGLHWAHALIKRKAGMFYVYFLPVIFSLIAIMTPNFVREAGCSSYFITAEHSWTGIIAGIYDMYYFGFIIYTAYLMFKAYMAKGKDWKIVRVGFIGILAFTVPTFILVEVFPSLHIMFPSILCEFAVLFALCLFYMIYLLEKRHR